MISTYMITKAFRTLLESDVDLYSILLHKVTLFERVHEQDTDDYPDNTFNLFIMYPAQKHTAIRLWVNQITAHNDDHRNLRSVRLFEEHCAKAIAVRTI